MDEYKLAIVMLTKLRPKMYDPLWIRAADLLKQLSLKGVKDIEEKKKTFIYVVNSIYENENIEHPHPERPVADVQEAVQDK